MPVQSTWPGALRWAADGGPRGPVKRLRPDFGFHGNQENLVGDKRALTTCAIIRSGGRDPKCRVVSPLVARRSCDETS